MTVAAHQVPWIYDRLGIQTSRLGAVMLDCEPVDLGDAIAPEDFYVSPHPDRGWIRGNVADRPHVTLLYGFLSHLWPDHESFAQDVHEVFRAGVVAFPEKLPSFGLTVFPSTLEDDPYACIVLELDPNPLLPLHDALTLLPHLSTFDQYRPHVTLAYVRPEAERRAIASLQAYFGGAFASPVVVPRALNLGGTRPWETEA